MNPRPRQNDGESGSSFEERAQKNTPRTASLCSRTRNNPSAQKERRAARLTPATLAHLFCTLASSHVYAQCTASAQSREERPESGPYLAHGLLHVRDSLARGPLGLVSGVEHPAPHRCRPADLPLKVFIAPAESIEDPARPSRPTSKCAAVADADAEGGGARRATERRRVLSFRTRRHPAACAAERRSSAAQPST